MPTFGKRREKDREKRIKVNKLIGIDEAIEKRNNMTPLNSKTFR